MTLRRSVVVALAAAALTVSGCTGGGDEGADEAPGAADAIDGFAFDPELVHGSFRSIHRLEREDPGALRQAAMERLGSPEPESGSRPSTPSRSPRRRGPPPTP